MVIERVHLGGPVWSCPRCHPRRRPWAQFLHESAELGDRLGPTMIQLPPPLGPPRLDALLRCLDALPRDRGFAIAASRSSAAIPRSSAAPWPSSRSMLRCASARSIA